tara:strand:- start:295 stop:558 length:264 start_codon:yes stop_codon:yes gene_type:complete
MRINAKNFFDRKVDKCLPHFAKTNLKGAFVNPDLIDTWIYEHCHGRYSISDGVSIKDNTVSQVMEIGFEEPGDLTLFALSGLMNDAQ